MVNRAARESGRSSRERKSRFLAGKNVRQKWSKSPERDGGGGGEQKARFLSKQIVVDNVHDLNLDQLEVGRCAESWLTPGGLKEHNPIWPDKRNAISPDKNRRVEGVEPLKNQDRGTRRDNWWETTLVGKRTIKLLQSSPRVLKSFCWILELQKKIKQNKNYPEETKTSLWLVDLVAMRLFNWNLRLQDVTLMYFTALATLMVILVASYQAPGGGGEPVEVLPLQPGGPSSRPRPPLPMPFRVPLDPRGDVQLAWNVSYAQQEIYMELRVKDIQQGLVLGMSDRGQLTDADLVVLWSTGTKSYFGVSIATFCVFKSRFMTREEMIKNSVRFFRKYLLPRSCLSL